MARISRRVGVNKHGNIENIALYARISVDDKSETIENQLDFLRAYAKEKKYEIYKEYVDIGKTGTNFCRSGFVEMINDMKDGKIKVIIVKDLSRLGRNYIETGEYIEKIFPLYGVKLIAVLDKYDSKLSLQCLEGSNDLFNYTLKNLVNEMYAMDISNKVKSTIRMKQKGEVPYVASVVPYGYRKCEEKGSKYIYEIDDKVAWVVKQIYSMYKENISISDITMWLCKMKINTPSVYRKEGKVYSDKDYTNWNKGTVHRILNNKIYYGVLEVNKTTSDFYDGKKVKKTDIGDRIYFENVTKPLCVSQVTQGGIDATAKETLVINISNRGLP